MVFDMVIAITVGVVLAAVLLMREIAQMTRLTDIAANPRFVTTPLAPGWQAYRITGPLFFAAADRIFAELAAATREARGVILYMEAVPLLDAGGLSALVKFVDSCRRNHTQVFFTELQFQPLKTLARARIQPIENLSAYYANLDDAIAMTHATRPE